MKVYNPTMDQVVAYSQGIAYLIEPGKYVELTEESGNWILGKFSRYGLVDITVTEPMSADKMRNHLVKKALEGLHAYLETLHSNVEAFMEFDTEMKSVNAYGTILKSKPVSEVTRKIEQVTKLISDYENKFGVKIADDEYKAKSENLINSVESIVDMFEQDSERQKKSNVEERKLNKLISETLPSIAVS